MALYHWKLTTFLPTFFVEVKGLTNFLHLHIRARELYGNRRAMSLLFMNLSPSGSHSSQTLYARLP